MYWWKAPRWPSDYYAHRVRGFLIVCAAVLVTIAIGVTVIAVQTPPGFYECPTTTYCLDLAKAVGVRGPILVPSEPELTARTGLLVQDRLFYFGDFPSYVQPDVPGQPLWLLRYDLSGSGNLRPLFFLRHRRVPLDRDRGNRLRCDTFSRIVTVPLATSHQRLRRTDAVSATS